MNDDNKYVSYLRSGVHRHADNQLCADYIDKLRAESVRCNGIIEGYREKCESQQAKVDELTAFLFKRTHMCGGRDCVGIYGEQTGSLQRCDDCSELLALNQEESDD